MTSTAQINEYGNLEWRNNKGQLHRENGPAREYANGNKEWYQNGVLHRENGPAREFSGYKDWFLNGQRHRENGPAVINSHFYSGYTEIYYLHDQTGSEIEQQVKENMVRIQAQKDKQEMLSV